MFVALQASTDTRTEADDASKHTSYICPKCKQSVIFARGPKIRWHFKHIPSSNCPYSKGETWQHEQAKSAIIHGARSRGLTAAPEVEILSIEGDRRADVVIWAPKTNAPKDEDARRYAFEVQYSSIGTETLHLRTKAYINAKVPVIWIFVLDIVRILGTDKNPKFLEKISGTGIIRSAGYSMPAWAREIEKMQGSIWVYIPQAQTFWKGCTLEHFLYKNYSEGYDVDGNEFSSGDYWYEAKSRRDLYLEGPYNFNSLKISRIKHPNKQISSENFGRKFLVDLLPNGIVTISHRCIQRRKIKNVNGFEDYVYWILVGSVWQLATFEAINALPSAK